MKRLVTIAAIVGLVALAGVVSAEDKVTGTWKWSTTFNNQTRETTCKLKLDGNKVTGAVLGRNNQETPIEEGTFKDGQISFKVTRERNGMKFSTKYSGKLEGDTIKGKSESERNGQTQSNDWEAKRDKGA